MASDTESIVITASGEDKVGLVEGLTRRINEAGCNIEESRMAALAGRFALLMRVTRINIESLETDTYPAPHTGAPMFAVHMTLGIPADAHIATLRGDFLDYCDDHNLDATFEPVRG